MHEIPTPIRPVPMTLYPTLNNLDEVIHLAKSKLPMKDLNKVYGLLMVYHNTLLNHLKA